MNDPKRILVTAALPYANGPLHLGHMAGAYLPSDMYVRYQRLKGRDVLFICGSDEHGVPITISAEQENISPQLVVDRYHAMNARAFQNFGMSFDNYSRTSLPLHHETAREFLLDFHKRGILKERQEEQFYDNKARMFLPDRYVEGICPVCGNEEARGDQCEKCGTYLNPRELKSPRSKVSGETPVVKKTSHLYFPLGSYQKRLEAYVKERSARDGWKENVVKYCQTWFNDGLQDRAVTRDLAWGVKIPLPGYEKKVIYVWFDAVLGYVSSTKEWAQKRGSPDAWKKYWLDEGTKYVAFIGKDNVVFHCIVFPAMLMAWNDDHQPHFVLPENVPANEFLNYESQKFSKSRGWGVDLQDFLERYPADALRYYLAVSLPEYRDADFTWKDFQARTNNELADILGNFVNRTLAFAHRTFGGKVPARSALSPLDDDILRTMSEAPDKVSALFEAYRFREGVAEIMNLARAANKYFNDAQPWVTAKKEIDRCGTTINICLQLVRSLAVIASPVVPFAADKIWLMMGFEGNASGQSWDGAKKAGVPDGQALGKADILFKKIEDETIEKELDSLDIPEQTKPTVQSSDGRISIDDFRKIALRIARIVECEKVPKSEKLLKLQVEIGKERRQVLAGIAAHYAPEELLGKLVVVVANLKPAKLMGLESEGMILAASDETGKLVLVSPVDDIENGSIVR